MACPRVGGVTLVLLVRHGLTAGTGTVLTGRMPGIPLDDRGREQAAALAARLAGVPLDAIVTSPLERCRQTADAIAAARNGHPVAVQEDERLAEVRYGDWTGQAAQTAGQGPAVAGGAGASQRGPLPWRRTASPCLMCSTGRVGAIRDWNARLGPKAIYLVCSHGDVIKSLIADSLGMHLDMFQRIQVDPCSLSVIRYTPLRPFLLRMNDTGGDGERPAWPGVVARRRDGGQGAGRGSRRRGRGHRRRSGRIGPCRSTHTIRRTGSSPGRSASRGSGASTCRPAPAGRVTSVALEKFQVSLLAERLDELLDEVLRRTGGRVAVPATAPAELADDAPLDLPLMEDFRVGAIALAWDGEDERVVIEAQEETENPVEPLAEEVPEDGPGVLRVRITPAEARAFSQRALQIVAQGRPACPLCGLPLDAEGHICPRQNGHRVGDA